MKCAGCPASHPICRLPSQTSLPSASPVRPFPGRGRSCPGCRATFRSHWTVRSRPFLQSPWATSSRASTRSTPPTFPPEAEHWGYRCGEPVTDTIDRWAEHAAAELADLFDPTSVREAWRRLRDVPEATEAACWVHTDLSEENLLAHHGRATGRGDRLRRHRRRRPVRGPALRVEHLRRPCSGELLRVASGADDATWTRARAWAFVGPGLLTIAHYRHTMPSRVDRLTSMVETVAAEVDIQLR